MSEKSKNKREWVKTAAIIFLSVMLVLTFFSQTIMNYSLPIVTAQYINSGQISAKVRGSGKIESADLYNVQIPETRDIQSIEVKKGDKVEKDQVMIHLKDKESDELKTAKEELEKLQVDYKKALLDGGISGYVYSDAVAGREDSTDGYRAKINAAKARVDSIDAQIMALNNQKRNETYNAEVEAINLDTKIKNAQNAMDNASADRSAAAAAMEALGGSKTPTNAKYGSKDEAEAAMNNAKQAMAAYEIGRDSAQKAMNDAYEEISKLQAAYSERSKLESEDSNYATDHSAVDAAFGTWLSTNPTTGVSSNTEASAIQSLINTKNGTPTDTSTDPITPATGYYAKSESYTQAQAAFENANKTYLEAKAAFDGFSQNGSSGDYNSAKAAYDKANSAYVSAQNELENLNKIKANASLTGKDLENKIAQLEDEQKKAQSDLDQLLKDIPGEIELNSTARILKEKQEELQKLLDNAIGATIDAPIAGTIVDVNVVSGGKAEANATVVTIQPENKGFTLSVPVTAEQAKKVSVGSIAEVQNSWYYNDITVELKKIQNDPANPGKSKLLVFDVSGDVSAGQELSISVGSKSQGYDMIVPNSAIRSDNNGKFILIVESKSSPIGNRYYASRVDIEVLAEDDTSTAISAPIESWEYVITAANKPVEAGKQVRLQD